MTYITHFIYTLHTTHHMSGSTARKKIPPHEESAGRWALDKNDSLVPAWDFTRTPRGSVGHHHNYFCSCTCGASVALKRGEILEAHFAYIATDRIGCGGGKVFAPESEAHYKAKWLLHDSFAAKTFRDVCGDKHVIETHTYTPLEWEAFVEKKIPETNRIADVLLWNSSTKEAVALEVYHTHAVDQVKYDECKNAGVRLIELRASEVNTGIHELDNIIHTCEWATCPTCEQDRKMCEEQDRLDDEKWEREYEARERRRRWWDEKRQREYEKQKKIHDEWLNEWWDKEDPVQEFQDAQEEREDIQRKELEYQCQEFLDSRETQRKEREKIKEAERIEKARVRQETESSQQQLWALQRVEQKRVQQDIFAHRREELAEREQRQQEKRARERVEREAVNERMYQREDDERNARRTFLRNAGVWCPSAAVLQAEDAQTAKSRSGNTY
jgi:hypothetical protein